MTTHFATPPMGGFNVRGAAPAVNGHEFGGAATSLGELVRGGLWVLRMWAWHDNAIGATAEAPYNLILQTRGPTAEKISVVGIPPARYGHRRLFPRTPHKQYVHAHSQSS